MKYTDSGEIVCDPISNQSVTHDNTGKGIAADMDDDHDDDHAAGGKMGKCESRYEYRTRDGRCLTCPQAMMASPDGENCVPVHDEVDKNGMGSQCGPDAIYNINGGYCIHCPLEMRASPDGSRCVPVHDMSGYEEMNNCGVGEIPQLNGGCIAYSCNKRQRVLPDGHCQYCPAF